MMLDVFCGAQEPLKNKAAEQVRAILDRGGHCLILVPETATLKTERFFLKRLGLQGSFDLEVLSPSHLEENVFAALGRGEGESVTLDERGKAVAVAAALKGCKEELVYYGRVADLQGFVQQISETIRDLKRAGVTPETLSGFAQGLPQGASRDRVADLALILEAYENRMGGRLVDGEDVNRQMLQRIGAGSFGKGMDVMCLDFDLITVSQASLLITLCRAGARVTLYQRYLTGDNLYRPVGESLGRLRRAAAENNVPCEFHLSTAGDACAKEDLGALRRLFPWDSAQPWAGQVANVRLYTGATPYEEMLFTVNEIHSLHEKGVRYDHMSVVMLSPEEYYGPLKRLLEQYHIPHYLPRSQPAAGHDAARFLMAALRCAFLGYEQEDLLALLQTGYTGLEEKEIWQLAAYIRAYGIHGKLFVSPFTRGEEAEAAAAAAARDRILPPLNRLREATPAGSTTDALLEAIMAYLEEMGVYDRLIANEQTLLDLGLMDEAAKGRQMWNGLMSLMDQIHAIMGSEELPRGLMMTQIEAALKSHMLTGLPPDSGSVQCLPAGGVAQENLEAVFICGFNDDAFSPGPEGLIPDEDRAALEAFGKTHIRPNAMGREDLKRLSLYRALCSADGTLYLTRATASIEGQAKRAHPYLNRIRVLLPGLKDEGGLTRARQVSPVTPLQAADELVRLFSSGQPLPPEWQRAWHNLCVYYPDMAARVLEAFRPPEKIVSLSPKVAEALYPERSVSVSRLEAFAACPYKHFIQYGLKPMRKKEWRVDAAAAGSFYHSALESFTLRLKELEGWPDVSKEAVFQMVEQVSGELFDARFGEMAGDMPRVQALKDKYIRVLKRVAWSFTLGARRSAFTLYRNEIRFGFPEEDSLPPVPLVLPDGTRVLLRGIIDRVDRYEGDEGLYFRVVDYKSGARKLEPEQIYYGTQLQLLIYLAALEGVDNANPAGAYYMRLTDPLVPDREDQEALEKALAKKCALSGITLKDARIVRLMDSDRPPVSMEPLLKVSGEFMENKPVATLEQMKTLILHARESARQMFVALRKGAIAREPLKIRKGNCVCDYCDYAAMCHKDEAEPRVKEKMTYEEMFQKINNEE